MAFLMETGSIPKTESEIADLDAITAIKESAALELKENGNQFVKKGKKHYSDAIDCYTRAINQKALSDSDNSLIYSNRSHVNLLLGNYRRARNDAEEAIKLFPQNVKAFYRAAKSSFLLDLFDEAKLFSQRGLELEPNNEELQKIKHQIESRKSEHEHRENKVSKAMAVAKSLVSAFESRGLKIGKPMYQGLAGQRKPVLDTYNLLHWPVLLLYAEVMSSDIIEDFCETDMFSAHLDMLFSENGQSLPWDTEANYTRDSIELYYEGGSGTSLPGTKLLHHLLEGTAAAHLEGSVDEEKDSYHGLTAPSKSSWAKVNEKRTLHSTLTEPNFVIPGIPVFYVVSKKSSFYKEFKAGKWQAPS